MVAAIAVMFGPRLVFGPTVVVEAVTRANFVQSVVATGRVETPHRIDVGVQVTGTVQRVPVAEGQVVGAGATLIELESSELASSVNEAQHGVQTASQGRMSRAARCAATASRVTVVVTCTITLRTAKNASAHDS